MNIIRKVQNSAKLAASLFIGYPKGVSDALTDLVGDKLKEKVMNTTMEVLRKNPEFRRTEEQIRDMSQKTKRLFGIDQLEQTIGEIKKKFKDSIK